MVRIANEMIPIILSLCMVLYCKLAKIDDHSLVDECLSKMFCSFARPLQKRYFSSVAEYFVQNNNNSEIPNKILTNLVNQRATLLFEYKKKNIVLFLSDG